MKKILVMMVFVIGMMLSWVGEAKAVDCPIGYSEVTVHMLILGCEYDVIFCVDCSLNQSPITTLIVKEAIPTYGPCGLFFSDVYNEIILQASDNYFIKYNLCPTADDPPPCYEEEHGELTVVRYTCWKWDGVKYEPCSDGICTTVYDVCWDENIGYVYTLVSAVKTGDFLACEGNEEPPVPTPGVCFEVETACQ